MSKFPKAREAKTFTPAWMRRGRALYGDAFEPKKKSELAESMADWAEMSEEERSFVAAHLQYLGLQAQLGTQKLLRELRALFEEVGDEVIDAIEVALEEQAGLDASEADEADEAVDGDGDEQGEGRHLELVEDTAVPDFEPDPRVMPVEAVAPEMLRGADAEPAVELPGVDRNISDDEPPEGA